jgi:hypothetical protein
MSVHPHIAAAANRYLIEATSCSIIIFLKNTLLFRNLDIVLKVERELVLFKANPNNSKYNQKSKHTTAKSMVDFT